MEKEKKQQQNKSPKTRKQEKLTEREWKEIRGEFMPTYYKKNGAWRSK